MGGNVVGPRRSGRGWGEKGKQHNNVSNYLAGTNYRLDVRLGFPDYVTTPRTCATRSSRTFPGTFSTSFPPRYDDNSARAQSPSNGWY